MEGPGCIQIRLDDGWCSEEYQGRYVYLAVRVGEHVQQTKTYATKKGYHASWRETLLFPPVNSAAYNVVGPGLPVDVYLLLFCTTFCNAAMCSLLSIKGCGVTQAVIKSLQQLVSSFPAIL